MAKATQPIPPGFHTLTVHLAVWGCAEYIDFLTLPFNAVDISLPVQDQFWGDRYSQLQGPEGFAWAIATRVRGLAPEELEQRAAAAFGGGNA